MSEVVDIRPLCLNPVCLNTAAPRRKGRGPSPVYCSDGCRRAVRASRLSEERRSLAPYARRVTR